MFDVDKVTRVDICTNNGNVLQSLTKGFSFPRFQDSETAMVRLLIVKGNNLQIYSRGVPVIVVVYLKSGDRLSYASVITVSTESQLNVGIYLDRTVVLEERRRYYKVECNMPCKVVSYSRNKQVFEFDPVLDGRILNINIGGVFLEIDTDLNLQVGDVVTAIIPHLNKDGAEYFLHILRTQTSPDGRPVGYGCKFLYLDAAREEFLGQFINMMQVEKRRQSKTF